jgi:AraC family transcriptional activator of pobA
MEEEQQTARKPSRKEDIFHKFLDLVHEHHQNERSVSYYADELCLSPKYLSRIVQEITGRHPTDWIRDYVILDAKTMLKSCEYTIQQISERLHFPNQSFFGKYFKKEVAAHPRISDNEKKAQLCPKADKDGLIDKKGNFDTP